MSSKKSTQTESANFAPVAPAAAAAAAPVAVHATAFGATFGANPSTLSFKGRDGESFDHYIFKFRHSLTFDIDDACPPRTRDALLRSREDT